MHCYNYAMHNTLILQVSFPIAKQEDTSYTQQQHECMLISWKIIVTVVNS